MKKKIFSRIDQPEQGSRIIIPFHPFFDGFLPAGAVMDGPGPGDHPDAESGIIQTLAPVVVLSPVWEKILIEKSDLPDGTQRNQPVRRHNPLHGDDVTFILRSRATKNL